MKPLKIIAVIGLLAVMPVLSAQQFPLYSQYIMNGFLINPSYAGSDYYTTFGLTVREQWLNLPEAPSTYAAAFQTRILNDSYITKSTAVRKKSDDRADPAADSRLRRFATRLMRPEATGIARVN